MVIGGGTRVRWGALTLAIVAVTAVLGGAAPAWAQTVKPGEFPCDIQTTERIVAVGDIHGAFDGFVAILRAAGLIDNRNRWTGQRAVLVQTGDILDRGADSKRVVDLLRRLERDAQRAGGRVVSLLGNHEVMRIVDDLRYLSPGEVDAFRNADSAAYRDSIFTVLNERAAQRARTEGRVHDAVAFRDQFLKEVPLGYIEMRQAFGPQGDYGKWVRERPTVARINGILFLHGGISPEVAPLGCVGVNAAVRKELASLPVPPEQLVEFMAVRETGPLWYRGLASEPEEALEPVLATTLDQMQARAIVIGHTPVLPARIGTRLGGRVMQIDTGMLNGEFYPKGAPAALEIRGETVTAIYLDRREPIAAPALQPAPAASTR